MDVPDPSNEPLPQVETYQFHTSPFESAPLTVNVEFCPELIIDGFAVANVGSDGIKITLIETVTQLVVLHVPIANT